MLSGPSLLRAHPRDQPATVYLREDEWTNANKPMYSPSICYLVACYIVVASTAAHILQEDGMDGL